MIQSTARLLMILKIHKAKRITHITLKNRLEYFEVWIFLLVKLKNNNIGRVPIAKLSIVSQPIQKLPVVRV